MGLKPNNKQHQMSNSNNKTYRIYNQNSQQWLLEDASIIDIALADNQTLRNAMAHDQYAEDDDKILIFQELLVREGDYENNEMNDFYEGDIVEFRWGENEPVKIGVVRKSLASHAMIEVSDLKIETDGIFEHVETLSWLDILSYKKCVIGNIFDDSIEELEEFSEQLTEEGF